MVASPNTQTANAIRAINERANIPVPEIDFTVHELENGEIVRTDERVVKDVSGSLLLLLLSLHPACCIERRSWRSKVRC